MENKTIALYMRLSDEDDDKAKTDESNSISHQRKLMLDYVAGQPDLSGCDILEFSDDGYSGTDFERPDFQKMMKMVKAGQINIIITKDYSRLGRDYLEVGNYMECIFPLLQIRYISVNDHYDSDLNNGATGGMGVALKNLVNAMYCKDASRKVRSAKMVLAKQGKYIASFAPYGYRKSAEDKHRLEPDPEAAPVVKMIFEMAADGKKYTEISNILNGAGQDSILEYYDKKGIVRNHCRDFGQRMWNPTTVMEVLYNEVYIGKVINNKFADNLDTGHKVIAKEKEDWIVVENCHEPLVSLELFHAAHRAVGRRDYQKRQPAGKWRRAFIVCGHCGKAMCKYNNGKSYRCRSGHVKLNALELQENILACAKAMAESTLKDLRIKKEESGGDKSLASQIEVLRKQLGRYNKQKFEVYDSYTKGNLTREAMAEKNASLKQKIAEIEEQISEKAEELAAQKESCIEEQEGWLDMIAGLEEFDADRLRCIIQQVNVYAEDKIEIVWNMDDFFSVI